MANNIEEETEKTLSLKLKYVKKMHELKMKELEFIRETDKLHHERELTLNRIKSAEIRKMQERKHGGFPQ